jgi:Synergist-CTERM protein sorting domain-containing protein
MAWPQALGAGVMEIEPLSGPALEAKAATPAFKGKNIVLAQTIHAKINSPIVMHFQFLTRDELREHLPTADFWFWNYRTEQYDLLPRNPDGSVLVMEPYWGVEEAGDFGIIPIRMVATSTGTVRPPHKPGDPDGDKDFAGCNAGFAIFVLLMIPAVVMRRRK